jgi:hypothetical protein
MRSRVGGFDSAESVDRRLILSIVCKSEDDTAKDNAWQNVSHRSVLHFEYKHFQGALQALHEDELRSHAIHAKRL